MTSGSEPVSSGSDREAERLAEVRRYAIESEAERDFKALAELASAICETPVAQITIVEEDRLWFKAEIGSDLGEVARELTFCTHAIERPNELFVIEDATADDRFRANPLVAGEPHVRFYAGMPVVTRNGHALGALCVVDIVPRTLSPTQAQGLQTLAKQVSAQFELRRTGRELAERQAALDAARDRVDERTLENLRLRQASDRDPLTGLRSRAHFERAADAIISRRQSLNASLALLVVDIDHFREVNESCGVSAGDLVLCKVAEIVSSVRTDAIVARLSGDTFGILVQLADTSEVAAIADTIERNFEMPFDVGLEPVWLSASIGVAHVTNVTRNSADLLGDADNALTRARSSGGGTWAVYRSEMSDAATTRAALKGNLREALANDQFELHYQPKIDLGSLTVVGYEALLRWNHPQAGVQSPADFIPVAERSGLIVPIGEWVIREAARQYNAWRSSGRNPVPIAVNVSAVQFQRSNILPFLTRTLRDFALPPEALEIEITEGSLIDFSDNLIDDLLAVRKLGVGIALDDFGTGFSSLAYLRRLPLSLIKVDKMFVGGALTNASDAAIVRSVVHLAKQLGLRTVAEGVETREQCDFVMECGCDEAQGYLFGRPLAASELPHYRTSNARAIRSPQPTHPRDGIQGLSSPVVLTAHSR